MDQRGKVIAGSILGVALLCGLYGLSASHHNNPTPLPPLARQGMPGSSASSPAAMETPGGQPAGPSMTPTGQLLPATRSSTVSQTTQTYTTAAPGVGTMAVPRPGSSTVESGTALVPTYDTRTAGAVAPGTVPTNATLVPITDGTARQTTTAMATTTTYHRVGVRRHHRYEKPGNIHLARGAKHTIAFAAKLPFRLRP